MIGLEEDVERMTTAGRDIIVRNVLLLSNQVSMNQYI